MFGLQFTLVNQQFASTVDQLRSPLSPSPPPLLFVLIYSLHPEDVPHSAHASRSLSFDFDTLCYCYCSPIGHWNHAYIYIDIHISIALIESLLGNLLLLLALIICNKVEAKQVNKLQTDRGKKDDFSESVTSLKCINQAIAGGIFMKVRE